MKLLTGLATIIAIQGFLFGGQFAQAQSVGSGSGFTLGNAANFGDIYTGAGENNLNMNNGTFNGNIGIGNPYNVTPQFAPSGPLTVNGDVDFAGAVNTNGNIGGNVVIHGTFNGNVAQVATDLNNLQALSTALGGEAGSNLVISIGNNVTQTVNAASGQLDAHGNRVFNVSGFAWSGNNNALVINGDGAGDPVVLNLSSSVNAQFKGGIVLTGGLTSDQVLFNIYGGTDSAWNGGPSLTINANNAILTGTFLDPNGSESMDSAILDGRIFGGDMHDQQIVSNFQLTEPVPEPSSYALVLSALGLLGVATRKRTRRS